MPQGIPQGFIAPKDGVHTFKVEKVATEISRQFNKPQEVIQCSIIDAQDSESKSMRVFLPHDSKKWYDQFLEAGALLVNEETEEWEVRPGAIFRVVIQGGKVVQVFKL